RCIQQRSHCMKSFDRSSLLIRQYVFNDDDDDVENTFEHISHIYDYSPG
ncbi:unnamed protein product, partial [Rotaria sordida]